MPSAAQEAQMMAQLEAQEAAQRAAMQRAKQMGGGAKAVKEAQMMAQLEAQEAAQRAAMERAKKSGGGNAAAKKEAQMMAQLEAQEAAQRAAMQAAKKGGGNAAAVKEAQMMAQLEAQEAAQRAAMEKAKKSGGGNAAAAREAQMMAQLEAQEAAQRAAMERAKKGGGGNAAAKKEAQMMAQLEAQEAAQRAAMQAAKKGGGAAAKEAQMMAQLEAQEAAQRAAMQAAKKGGGGASKEAQMRAQLEAQEAAQRAAMQAAKAKKGNSTKVQMTFEEQEAAQRAAMEAAKADKGNSTLLSKQAEVLRRRRDQEEEQGIKLRALRAAKREDAEWHEEMLEKIDIFEIARALESVILAGSLSLFSYKAVNGQGVPLQEALARTHPDMSKVEDPWAYGCEPRIDYSDCGEMFVVWCPIFYQIFFGLYLVPYMYFTFLLVGDYSDAMNVEKATADHDQPGALKQLGYYMHIFANDTILQLKIGAMMQSAAAVLHHAAMLTPTPPRGLPGSPVLVELFYNMNICFMLATLLGTLRYWVNFMDHCQVSMGNQAESKSFGGGGFLDKVLIAVFDFKGALCIGSLASIVFFATDAWGLATFAYENWRMAVRVQLLLYGFLCFFITFGFLRIGYLLEANMRKVLDSLSKRSATVASDAALQSSIRRFIMVLRFAYLSNAGLCFVCFTLCALAGALFSMFYSPTFWMLLMGFLNIVGLLFSLVVVVISSKPARDVETHVQELLVYLQELVSSDERGLTPRTARGSLVNQHAHTNFEELKSDDLEAVSTYPCYVMSLANLMKYNRIPPHEQALHDCALLPVTTTSHYPCRAHCHFVSHTWIANSDGTRDHPDGDPDGENPKLTWLKEVAPLLLLADPSRTDSIFIFMDYFSIPQQDRICQMNAISSLPAYAATIRSFLPLVKDPKSIPAYLRRGWCSTECVCAMTPKLNRDNTSWRLGQVAAAMRFRFYQKEMHAEYRRSRASFSVIDPETKAVQDALDITLLKNPMDPKETDFFDEGDREKLEPLMLAMAIRMQRYEQSGSKAYHRTLDIHARPRWIKKLAHLASVGKKWKDGLDMPDDAFGPAVNGNFPLQKPAAGAPAPPKSFQMMMPTHLRASNASEDEIDPDDPNYANFKA